MKRREVTTMRGSWPLRIALVTILFCSLVPARAAGGLYGWGANYYRYLANDSAVDTTVPVGINLYGIPVDVSIVSLVAGTGEIFVLGSDGRIYSWGLNESGQLGNGSDVGSDNGSFSHSTTPVAVDNSGVLAGKTIESIAAGSAYAVALSTDGQLYSWGRNEAGNLGNGTTINSNVPVAVDMSGALAGKTIKAVAAGMSRCMVLASDGRLYQWGRLGPGEWSANISSVPVAVDMGDELPGKTITAMAASTTHSLVLTADNRLYSWGDNFAGQLGNGTQVSSTRPVAVDMSGVLSGQTISAITVGGAHCLVLTTAGRVYGWGYNMEGALGTGVKDYSLLPVAVDTTGVLAGKTVVAISSKVFHNLALDSEGRVYSWGGYNMSGELGDGTKNMSLVPIAVATKGVLASKTGTLVAAGGYFSLAMATGGDMTPPDVAVTAPAKGAVVGQ